MNTADSHTLSRRSVLATTGLLPILALSGAGTALAAGAPATAGMKVQRLAWAGVRLQVGAVAVFVDAIAPNPQIGIAGPELANPGTRAFALVTHHHGDHCDPAGLKPVLGEHGYLVAHDETARLFDNRIVNVQAARMHEPVFLSRGAGEFVARCVPAIDGLGGPQVSWVIEGGGKRVIHCGDTGWHGGWWNAARAYGPFDAAFLPINGFRQTDGMFTHVEQPMSLTPEQASLAARILGARAIVPIHFGGPADPGYVEEPQALARLTAAAAGCGVAIKTMAVGDIIDV